MLEILDKIYKAIVNGLQRQNFEYKVYNLNGTEPNKQLKIANSIQYEFVNSGNSIAVINDIYKIYPKWCGIEPTHLILNIHKNETDVSVYEYHFEDVPNGFGVAGLLTNAAGFNSGLVPYNNAGAVAPFNLLQVIVKQRSTQ